MSLPAFSGDDVTTIQDVVSECSSSIPLEVVKSSILHLQGPIFEYVSKYIPAEYDDSFEDIDTWLNSLSDLIIKRPRVMSSVKLSGEDSSMVFRERCLRSSEKKYRFLGRIRNMDPSRKGTRPHIITEFRKTVAIILVILALSHLITEDNPALLFAVEKIQENKIKIMEALINKYTSIREKKENRLVKYGRTRDVEYLD